jgi:1-acyl-sn-glycerol-3-phosphate acyltransferase
MSENSRTRARPLAVSLLVALLGYGGYAAANVAFLLMLLPLLPLVPFGGRRLLRPVFDGFLRVLTRWYLPLVGGYRIAELSGCERVPKGSVVVYAPNHRSRIDAPLLLGLLPGCGAVIKSTYAGLPVFSSLVKYFDFVSVNQHSLDSLRKAVDKCRYLMDRGTSMIIFPEGTRARSGRLGRFHDLAFRLAAESGAPVVPVAVHFDGPILAKRPGSILPWRRLELRIRFLEPQTHRPGQTHLELSERVRSVLARELELLDKGTIWE